MPPPRNAISASSRRFSGMNLAIGGRVPQSRFLRLGSSPLSFVVIRAFCVPDAVAGPTGLPCLPRVARGASKGLPRSLSRSGPTFS